MSKRPRVSVLMSVYNGERYLSQAVDSILGQTYTDFEFVIVDDASSDRTPDILDGYVDPRIVRLRLDRNRGLPGALNEGLRLAKGAYIARQDADDVSLPERLECQVAYLDSHADVGLLGCTTIVVDEKDTAIHTFRVPLTNQEIQRRFPWRNSLTHGSVMIRRTCLERVGSYRSIFRRAQDRDLWLRLAQHCQISNLPQVLYRWRFCADAYTVRKVVMMSRYSLLAIECSLQTTADDEQALLATAQSRIRPRPFSPQWWHGRRYIARKCRRWAWLLSAQPRFRQALSLYVASLVFSPADRATWKLLLQLLLGRKMVGVIGQVLRHLSHDRE